MELHIVNAGPGVGLFDTTFGGLGLGVGDRHLFLKGITSLITLYHQYRGLYEEPNYENTNIDLKQTLITMIQEVGVTLEQLNPLSNNEPYKFLLRFNAKVSYIFYFEKDKETGQYNLNIKQSHILYSDEY